MTIHTITGQWQMIKKECFKTTYKAHLFNAHLLHKTLKTKKMMRLMYGTQVPVFLISKQQTMT